VNFHFCPNDSKNEKDFPLTGKSFSFFILLFLLCLQDVSSQASQAVQHVLSYLPELP